MLQPVYFVRHGQSEWNVLERTQGQIAHPRLTALGRQQATTAASWIAADLAGRQPTIVTSDLTRAVETAAVLADRLGATVQQDARLRERHVGWLEGRSHDARRRAVEQQLSHDPDARLGGGESVREVHLRVAELMAELDGTVPTVLVTHGDTIRIAQGTPNDEVVANGAVVRLGWSSGSPDERDALLVGPS